MRLLRPLVITALLAAGCAAEDTVIARTFDPCAPLGLELGAATAGQRAGVADAISLWRDRGVTGLAVDAIDAAPILPLVFEVANETFHGYYDDAAGVIYVNVALDDEPAARAIAIAHELGHAFGLYHVPADERASLMNPHNLTVGPTSDDALALAALWGTCDRRPVGSARD